MYTPPTLPDDPARDAVERALDPSRRSEAPGVPLRFDGAIDAPPPTIRLAGYGPLVFPVPDLPALRAVCERAPYGDGGRTVTDAAVRSAWQIDPAVVEIDDPGFAARVQAMADAAAAALDFGGPVRAELYKLLIYEPGHFFKPHRDNAKAPGHVGTMVVGLPSAHAGGALAIRRWGRERRGRLVSTASRTAFTAFHADCLHELAPVTGGLRVCLSFNLIREAQAPLEAAEPIAEADTLAALEAWRARGITQALVIPLEQIYTAADLAAGALRGPDRAIARRLVPAARAAGCPVYAARLQVDDFNDGMCTDIQHFQLLEGAPLAESPPWRDRGFDPAGLCRLEGWSFLPCKTLYYCWSGNEGNLHLQRYRQTALVVLRSADAPAPPLNEDAPHARGFRASALAARLRAARDQRWRRLDLSDLPPSDRLPEALMTLERLEELDLSESWLPEEELAQLKALPRLRSLILKKTSLERFPAGFERLERLDLSGSRGVDLSGLSSASALRELTLRGCGLRRLPDGMGRLALERLDLHHNQLRRLPEGLNLPGALRALDVSQNQLKRLPDGLFTEALETLDASYNPLTAIDALAAAPRLRSLHLDHTELPAPPPLDALPALESVDLSNTPHGAAALAALVGRPGLRRLILDHAEPGPPREDWSAMVSLESLSLVWAKLSRLPASLLALPNLRELGLLGNRLRGLDLQTPALEQIDLTGNVLFELPYSLTALPRLRVIRAERARLTHLPRQLPAGLRELHLEDNKITALPGSLCGLAKLEVLDLSRNQLDGLPEAIGGLTALRRLDVSGSPLAELPEALWSLAELEELDLSACRLRALPAGIGQLASLRQLRITENRALTALPDAICRLSSLSSLGAMECGLITLPVDLSGLCDLRFLTLYGNPLADRVATADAIRTLPDLHSLCLAYPPSQEFSGVKWDLEQWLAGEEYVRPSWSPTDGDEIPF